MSVLARHSAGAVHGLRV